MAKDQQQPPTKEQIEKDQRRQRADPPEAQDAESTNEPLTQSGDQRIAMEE